MCVQKAPKGQSRVERLRKKMNEQESWLLLHSPTIPFRIHNKHGKVLSSPFFCLNASNCSVYVSPLDGGVHQSVNCVVVNFFVYICDFFFRSFSKQMSHVFFDILQLFLFLCVSRAICFSCHQIMRGQNGRKAYRNSRRKVTQTLILPS